MRRPLVANKLTETPVPPSNSTSIADAFRDLCRGADPELYQLFVDIMVEEASPDSAARKKKRDALKHAYNVLYVTGGEIPGPGGKPIVIKPEDVRKELATEHQYNKAVELGNALKEAQEVEDTVRKGFGSPMDRGNKRLKEIFDLRAGPLQPGRDALRHLCGAYLTKQRDAAKAKAEEERLAAAAAAKAAQAAAAKAAAENDEAAQREADKLQAQADAAATKADKATKAIATAGNKSASGGGGAHLRVSYRVEITNFAIVTNEFKVLNEEKAIIEMRPRSDGSPGRQVQGLKLIKIENAVLKS
jgi:hypothetical protein